MEVMINPPTDPSSVERSSNFRKVEPCSLGKARQNLRPLYLGRIRRFIHSGRQAAAPERLKEAENEPFALFEAISSRPKRRQALRPDGWKQKRSLSGDS